MRLILSKATRIRTRYAITSRSFQITPVAMWRMRPRLTSIRTGDNTKKTFTTCGYLHRAEVHPRLHLQLRPDPRLHRGLSPRRGVVLLRRRDPDSRVISLPRRSLGEGG